jgi:galactokinase
VNLIGEHTDYNDGFVLPMAIDLECVVRARPRDDPLVNVGSGAEPYAAALVEALGRRGRPPIGIDATITSMVPRGAGLSSSAALEVALALALCDAAGFELPPLELALACREAEELATGVPCGIMDQLTSVAGRAGCALLIDCRSLAVEPVRIPDELAVLVADSGVRRTLAGSEYADRRAECERIARRLGLAALRDASPEQVRDEPRGRHVVSENARVLAGAKALSAGDGAAVGRLLSESHASLRDDYEVSTPELDALAAALEEAGALGARLTGAGFGGCVVAVAPRADAERVLAGAIERYGDEPWSHVCEAVDGAR